MRRCRSAPLVIAPRFYQPLPPLSPVGSRPGPAGFQQTSVTLEEAAQDLGCLPLRTLMKITVPLIMANLLAGALLAFSFAMLEVSGSLILAQRQQDYPITKAIYELYQVAG